MRMIYCTPRTKTVYTAQLLSDAMLCIAYIIHVLSECECENEVRFWALHTDEWRLHVCVCTIVRVLRKTVLARCAVHLMLFEGTL